MKLHTETPAISRKELPHLLDQEFLRKDWEDSYWWEWL